MGASCRKQLAIRLALDQQAADELGGDDLGGTGEEALGELWESVVAMGVAAQGGAEEC